MGIRKASKAEIPIWSGSELGIADDLTAAVHWPEIIAPPKVETQVEIIDGDSAEEKAKKLAARLAEEKVI
jgi:electron transfer flavoprotein alpha/beta subunit